MLGSVFAVMEESMPGLIELCLLTSLYVCIHSPLGGKPPIIKVITNYYTMTDVDRMATACIELHMR